MSDQYSGNRSSTRAVILDTETTGLSCVDGDKMIEIGMVELIDRKPTGRVFHKYIDPGFEIPEGSMKVHGLSREAVVSLGDGQTFADIADELLAFVEGAQVVIHNAPFDMGFLDKELSDLGKPKLSHVCSVFDTLKFAGTKFPGSRNNLDALCRRYGIDNTERTEHGALLDAQLLTDVYIQLTRHQVKLDLDDNQSPADSPVDDTQFLSGVERVSVDGLPVVKASTEEMTNHNEFIKKVDKKSGNKAVWEAETPVFIPKPAPF